MSYQRRQKREKERLMTKLHNKFKERIKGMTDDEVKEYVNKQVQRYSVTPKEDGN